VNELRVEAGNKPNEEDAQRILQSIRDASKRADLVMVYQHNHVYDKAFATIFPSSQHAACQHPLRARKRVISSRGLLSPHDRSEQQLL
jgi:hypothetical protein